MNAAGGLVIGFANPRLMVCRVCNGTGIERLAPGSCTACHGTGGHETDDWQLATLAHNLMIGAALCKAFTLGHDPQHGSCWLDFCDGWLQWGRRRTSTETSGAFRRLILR